MAEPDTTKDNVTWFAVRCVFKTGWPPEAFGRTYEERITLWEASSSEEAISKAEAEALEYAAGIAESPDAYLGLAQSYQLGSPPTNGAEVFSLMRNSDLEADEYLTRFFVSGGERVQLWADEPSASAPTELNDDDEKPI